MPSSGQLEDITWDHLVDTGFFFVGDPDTVHERILQHYQESGGYGVLLLVLGKDYGTRAQRTRSLKLFNGEIAPKLRGLDPDRDHATAPAPRSGPLLAG